MGMNTDYQEQDVRNIISLPSILEFSPALISPPITYLKLQDLVASDTASIDDIAEVVGLDTSATAKVLKLANSAHYGFRGTVGTISRAVTIMGLEQLTSIVMTLTVASAFSGLPPGQIDLDSFWNRSANTATIAVRLAKRIGMLRPESMLPIGILHDIGTLLLSSAYGRIVEHLHAIDPSGGMSRQFSSAYTEYAHGQLGADLLARWQFPTTITESIRHQHRPLAIRGTPLQSKVLYIASGLADSIERGTYRYAECDMDACVEVCEAIQVEGMEHELLSIRDAGAKDASDFITLLLS